MFADLPKTMTAIAISAPGEPDVLKPETRPMPTVGGSDVLIQIHAAGVNRPDVLQRRGLYAPPPGVTDIPGLEVAGTIVAVGQNVTRFQVGARVCALVAGGGYAEYCTAPEGQCLPIPKGASFVEAAAIPETFFTVWFNLFERGYAANGDSVLIHGGSSGIGTTAIMLAKEFGLTVYATAGSDEKCAACEKLGATRAINYRSADFVTEIKNFTEGRGVDIVLDMVAGNYVARNLDCLAIMGRHITIAVQGGIMAEINMAKIMQRRLTLTGSTLRPQSVEFKSMIAASLEELVWPVLDTGRCLPMIDSTYPLKDAATAHVRMESSAHIGKIVLEISSMTN